MPPPFSGRRQRTEIIEFISTRFIGNAIEAASQSSESFPLPRLDRLNGILMGCDLPGPLPRISAAGIRAFVSSLINSIESC